MNYELNYESSKIIHLIHCGDLVKGVEKKKEGEENKIPKGLF
jgi:hypothetical protein